MPHLRVNISSPKVFWKLKLLFPLGEHYVTSASPSIFPSALGSVEWDWKTARGPGTGDRGLGRERSCGSVVTGMDPKQLWAIQSRIRFTKHLWNITEAFSQKLICQFSARKWRGKQRGGMPSPPEPVQGMVLSDVWRCEALGPDRCSTHSQIPWLVQTSWGKHFELISTKNI